MKYEKNKSVVHAIKVLCSIAVFVCGLYLSFPAEAAGTFTEWGGTRLADYGSAVKCHTVVNADGSTAVMYSVWNGTQLSLYVDSFSDSGSKLSHKSVPLPGKSWGGTVYRAPDGCYYVLTGNSTDIAFMSPDTVRTGDSWAWRPSAKRMFTPPWHLRPETVI